MDQTLYEYYARQVVAPTYASFRDDDELDRYVELRERVFRRLRIPIRAFADRRLLEFGPDTGENALVFARWGAKVTLVEPNSKAHAAIRSYFQQFQLGSSLESLNVQSLLEYTPREKFDFVDAEGFIYTIQPQRLWLSKVAECLRPGGLFVLSYQERFGSFMELLLKALFHHAVRCGQPLTVETAWDLFGAKWDSIPHTRKFESWYMDVVRNPFVRAKYCLEPVSLLGEARELGFRLHASWPNYADSWSAEWIKAPLPRERELESSLRQVRGSRLAHALGIRCFLMSRAEEVEGALDRLVTIVDELIDRPVPDLAREARGLIEIVLAALSSQRLLITDADRTTAEEVLRATAHAFEILEHGEAAGLREFCTTNPSFIRTWGMPAHYAVLELASG